MKRIEIPIIKSDNSLVELPQKQVKTNNEDGSINYDRVLKMGRIWCIFFNDWHFAESELEYLQAEYNLEYSALNREKLKDLLIEDVATTFNCNLDEITYNIDKLKENPDRYVVFLGNLKYANKYSKLKYVSGNIESFGIQIKEEYFSSLEIIGGSAGFFELRSAESLTNLEYILGSAGFFELRSAESLTNLEYIGGTAHFGYLTDGNGLENLKYIGGIAEFPSLKDPSSLPNLEYVGDLEKSYIPTNIKTRVRKKQRSN